MGRYWIGNLGWCDFFCWCWIFDGCYGWCCVWNGWFYVVVGEIGFNGCGWVCNGVDVRWN